MAGRSTAQLRPSSPETHLNCPHPSGNTRSGYSMPTAQRFVRYRNLNGSLSPGLMRMGSPFQSNTTSSPAPSVPAAASPPSPAGSPPTLPPAALPPAVSPASTPSSLGTTSQGQPSPAPCKGQSRPHGTLSSLVLAGQCSLLHCKWRECSHRVAPPNACAACVPLLCMLRSTRAPHSCC